MDSHRLRAGPLNENIADITPLLEYTSTPCDIPALLAYYTSGLYYFVRLRAYELLTRPWNQVLRTYYFAAYFSQLFWWLPYWRLRQNNNNNKIILVHVSPQFPISLVCDSTREVKIQGLT